jgi:hypothetical protein
MRWVRIQAIAVVSSLVTVKGKMRILRRPGAREHTCMGNKDGRQFSREPRTHVPSFDIEISDHRGFARCQLEASNR